MGEIENLIELLEYANACLQISVRAKQLVENFVPGSLYNTVKNVNSINGEDWHIPDLAFEFYGLDTPGEIRRCCIKLAQEALIRTRILNDYFSVFCVNENTPIELIKTELSGLMSQILRAASSKLIEEANKYYTIYLIDNNLNVNDDKDNTGNSKRQRKIGGEDESNYKVKRQGFK